MDIQDNRHAFNHAESTLNKVALTQQIEYECIASNTSCNYNQSENSVSNDNKYENDGIVDRTVTVDKEARLEGFINNFLIFEAYLIK